MALTKYGPRHPHSSNSNLLCRILFIRTPNHVILLTMENPRSVESANANEGAMEGLHADKRITCLLRWHDDFADFFFDFIYLCSIAGLITKLSKESIMTLVYLIKLLKSKQNMGILSQTNNNQNDQRWGLHKYKYMRYPDGFLSKISRRKKKQKKGKFTLLAALLL